MKKVMRFFLNYVLISATIVNVVACQWNHNNNDHDFADKNEQDISCNYLVPDINNRTNKVIIDRLDIDGEDISSLKKYLANFANPWLAKTAKKLKFVDNLEDKLKFKASLKAINEFNNLDNKNSFKNFDDLQTQLRNYNLGKVKVQIDWNNLFKSLALNIFVQQQIKKQLLHFYNIFVQVYGKQNVFKMLYKMGFKNFSGNLMAQVVSAFTYDYGHYSLIQVMGCGPTTFSSQVVLNSYFSGWSSSKNIIEVICHEYGHLLGKFICLNLQERQNINSLADNNSSKWWNAYFNNWSFINKMSVETTKINDETNYLISSLADGTKINDPIYQKLLAYGIVRSNYGRESHSDLFAEAFNQWINTEESQRNIAWEKLDKFFRIDLPKVLSVDKLTNNY